MAPGNHLISVLQIQRLVESLDEIGSYAVLEFLQGRLAHVVQHACGQGVRLGHHIHGLQT